MRPLSLDSWICGFPKRDLSLVPANSRAVSFADWFDDQLKNSDYDAPSVVLMPSSNDGPDLSVLVADGREDHLGKFVLVLFSFKTSENVSVDTAKWIAGFDSLNVSQAYKQSSVSNIVKERVDRLSAVIRVHFVMPKPVCRIEEVHVFPSFRHTSHFPHRQSQTWTIPNTLSVQVCMKTNHSSACETLLSISPSRTFFSASCFRFHMPRQAVTKTNSPANC